MDSLGRKDGCTRSEFLRGASAGNTWTRANFYRTWFPVEYGNNE